MSEAGQDAMGGLAGLDWSDLDWASKASVASKACFYFSERHI